MAAILYFLFSAACASVWQWRLRLRRSGALWLLAWAVSWAVLVLTPVQAMAALQIAGLVPAVRLWPLVVAQVLILLLTIAWRATRGQPADLKTEQASQNNLHSLPRYLWICGAILAGSYLVFAVRLLASYPTGLDALAYHFPVALRWLQTGSLRIPASRGWQYALPGNAEIGMMLMLNTGRQSLMPVVNLFAAVVLALATYLIADRIAGGNKIAASAAAVIALSLPIVEFQAFSGYVDLFGSAFLLAAVALFLNRGEVEESGPGENARPGPGWSMALVTLSALASGISIGTKPVLYVDALLYGAVAALVLLRESVGRWVALAKAWAVIVAGMLIPSLFWFGRSFHATGNPVFPLQVKVGKHVILEGYPPTQITPNEFSDKFVRRRAEWAIYPWTEWHRNPGEQLVPYTEGSGLGAAFAAFVPLGLLVAIARFERSGATTQALLVAWLAMLAVWWLALQRMPRFGLPLWVIACALSAPMLGALDRFAARGFRALLVGCVAVTCAISMFVPLHELAGRARAHTWRRCDAYSYPHFIDDLSARARVVNNTGIEEANFYLAGERLSNQVIADFELPEVITPQFLQRYSIDFVVEALPEKADVSGRKKAANLQAPVQEVWSEVKDGKRWRVLRVDGRSFPHVGSAPPRESYPATSQP